MLAGVPLALARNMPGAGFANSLTIRLNPPLAACNPEVMGSTPPPPSIESKTVVFTVFFALQGCETQVKCTILRFSGYHYHLGCLDRLQIQHEEKSFIVGASSMMAVLASIWGALFFVTFKLPFHALPLLSPHPASFRSFTPGASSILK